MEPSAPRLRFLPPVFLLISALLIMRSSAPQPAGDLTPRMELFGTIRCAETASTSLQKPDRTTISATAGSAMIKVLHQMAHPGSKASSYYNLPSGSFVADFGAAAAVRDGWYACQNGIAERSSDTVHSRQLENLKQQHRLQLASVSSQISSKNALLAQSASCLAQMRREFGELIEKERSSTVQAATAQQQVTLLVAELRSTEARLLAVEARLAESARAAAHAQKAEQEQRRARAAADEARVAADAALREAPSRTEAQHAAREEQRARDSAALEQVRTLERDIGALKEAGRQLSEQMAGLQSTVKSEQIRRGCAVKELELVKAQLAKADASAQDTTLRNLERREKRRVEELDKARVEVAMLRERIQQLDAASPLDARLAAKPVTLQKIRTSDNANASLTGRSVEFLRRLVDESNGSFEGAATSNALVLGLHLGTDIPDSLLLSSSTIRTCFHRGGIADQEADAARNREDTGPWCIAQDAGGGTLMVATGHWDAAQQQPVARPLAASDLFRDQGARNGIVTLERAARRGGLNFSRHVASCSDGTDHAVQESEGFCAQTHKLGGRQEKGKLQQAQADFCCIHGKALEENSGMEAAFPNLYLVNALRLLWELIGGPEGRPDHYRGIWEREVQRSDGTKLPPLPAAFFHQNLKAMPEPTEAKWQVMFDTCVCISPLLDPFGNVLQVASRRCMLEIFLEKCLVLYCGSTDQEKAKRVVHPHVLKVQLLAGIFGKPDVYTAIYLTIDVWEQNFQGFHSFARSPAAYGGFAPPFLRHMMPERSAQDVVWYRAARLQPRQHLPKTFKFISSSRVRSFAEQMTAEVRSRLELRAAAFLEAAEAKCLKWNGSTWLRARFLFGTLCSEKRRRWFAAELLVMMGHGEQLDEELEAYAADAAGGAAQGAVGSRRATAPPPRPQPQDDVDRLLQERLKGAQEDGSLAASSCGSWIGKRWWMSCWDLQVLHLCPSRCCDRKYSLCCTQRSCTCSS